MVQLSKHRQAGDWEACHRDTFAVFFRHDAVPELACSPLGGQSDWHSEPTAQGIPT